MSISYKAVAHGSPEYVQALGLRDRMLRKPLGLEAEFLQSNIQEAKDWHFVAVQEEDETNDGIKVVANVILVVDSSSSTIVQLRQMAVDDSMQGKGIGKILIKFAEEQARIRGVRTIKTHARKYAQDFYTKQGYEAFGDVFIECGIPHILMQKSLN